MVPSWSFLRGASGGTVVEVCSSQTSKFASGSGHEARAATDDKIAHVIMTVISFLVLEKARSSMERPWSILVGLYWQRQRLSPEELLM